MVRDKDPTIYIKKKIKTTRHGTGWLTFEILQEKKDRKLSEGME